MIKFCSKSNLVMFFNQTTSDKNVAPKVTPIIKIIQSKDIDLSFEELFEYELQSVVNSETLSDLLKLFFQIDARQEIVINDDLSISFTNLHINKIIKEWKAI